MGCKKVISNTSLLQYVKPGKPEIKKLSNIKLLQELPFYDELSIVKSLNAFSGYAISYEVEVVDKKIL